MNINSIQLQTKSVDYPSRASVRLNSCSKSMLFASKDTNSVGPLSLSADSAIRKYVFDREEPQPFAARAKKSFLYRLKTHTQNVKYNNLRYHGSEPPFIGPIIRIGRWVSLVNPLAHLSSFLPNSKKVAFQINSDRTDQSYLYSKVYPYAALMRGNINQALKLFKVALEADKNIADVYFKLGDMAYSLMQYQKQLKDGEMSLDSKEAAITGLEQQLTHYRFNEHPMIKVHNGSYQRHIPILSDVLQDKDSIDWTRLRKEVLNSSIPFKAIALEAYKKAAKFTQIQDTHDSGERFQKKASQIMIERLSEQLDKAISLAENFYLYGKLNARPTDTQLLLSQLYSENGEHENAISLAGKILTDRDNSMYGDEFKQKFFSNLLSVCRNAVKDGYKNQTNFWTLALPYFKQSADYIKSYSFNSELTDGYGVMEKLGDAYVQTGAPDNAKTTYKEVIDAIKKRFARYSEEPTPYFEKIIIRLEKKINDQS